MEYIKHTAEELKEFIKACIESGVSSSNSGTIGDSRWFKRLANNNYIGGNAYMVYTFSKGPYDGFTIRKL